MANERKVIDEWAVKDLEDGSSIKVMVESCSELGNESVGSPGTELEFAL